MDNGTFMHLSELSKLSFTENEAESFISEMNDIINLMDKIKEYDINVENIKNDNAVNLSDLREDAAKPSLSREKLMRNANTDTAYFQTPKLID